MQSYILTCSRLNTENLFVVLASSVKWRTLISVYPMPHRGSQRRKGSERTVTPQKGQDQKVVRSKLALCSEFLWHSSLKTPVSLYFFLISHIYLFIYLFILFCLFCQVSWWQAKSLVFWLRGKTEIPYADEPNISQLLKIKEQENCPNAL